MKSRASLFLTVLLLALSLTACGGAPLQGSRCRAQKHSTHKFLWGEKLYEI